MAIREDERYREHVPQFENALSRTRELLRIGFDQEALSALARAIPKLFHLHKEWIPPIESGPDGRYTVPSWFRLLEPLDQAVTECAHRLRVIGIYRD